MTTKTQRFNALLKATEEQKQQLETYLDNGQNTKYNQLVLEILGQN
jgi:hypothetical protein